MNRLRARLRPQLDHESGFTLIEVVMAIVILSILSTLSLSIYFQSMSSATTQQRREIAITIANQTMESVNVWSTAIEPLSGVSSLYSGRTQAKVVQYWNLNAALPGVLQTYPMWDPRSPAVATEALPIKPAAPVIRSGTKFTVETLIGTCFQKRTGGDCTRISSYSGYPATISVADKAIYTPLTRVIVIVRWTAGSSCAGGACVYETATLIDLNTDLEWNTP